MFENNIRYVWDLLENDIGKRDTFMFAFLLMVKESFEAGLLIYFFS